MDASAEAGRNAPDAESARDAGTAHVSSPSAWPMLGHDLGSTYFNSAERTLTKQNAAQLRERFSIEVGYAIYGAPLLVEDKLYFNAGPDAYAIDVDDGTMLWKTSFVASGSVEPGMSNAMAYDDGKLFLQLGNADVVAIDAADGSMLWQVVRGEDEPLDLGYGSPIVAGDSVFVGRSSNAEMGGLDVEKFRGSLIALDKFSGKRLWRTFTVPEDANGVGIWSTPAVDLELGVVYATTANNITEPATPTADAFMAFDISSGQVLFSMQAMQDVSSFMVNASSGLDFGANPILFEAQVAGVPTKLMAAGAQSGWVYCMARESPQLLWSRQLGPGTDNGDMGILNNGTWSGKYLLFALNEGYSGENSSTLFALDPADGQIAWQRKLSVAADVLGRISVANGVGFVGVGSQLEVFDVDDGSLIKGISTGGPTAAGVTSIANGIVAFGTGANWLVHTDHEEGKLIVLETAND